MLRHADLSLLAGAPLPASDIDTDIVWERAIPFHSLCEQHLLPFYGVAHVGYLPGDTELGDSELARIVEACSRGIQIQQRMTTCLAAVAIAIRPEAHWRSMVWAETVTGQPARSAT
jgi:GTP cyclohydrolase I